MDNPLTGPRLSRFIGEGYHKELRRAKQNHNYRNAVNAVKSKIEEDIRERWQAKLDAIQGIEIGKVVGDD